MSLLLTIFIEHFKVVKPDFLCVFAHKAAYGRHQLLFAGDAMRIDHHEQRVLRFGLVCQLFWQAQRLC